MGRSQNSLLFFSGKQPRATPKNIVRNFEKPFASCRSQNSDHVKPKLRPHVTKTRNVIFQKVHDCGTRLQKQLQLELQLGGR